MSKSRTAATKPPKPSAAPTVFASRWPIWLGLVWVGTSLFLIPNCLDRYLAPRFLWLSATLLVGIFLLKKTLSERADWRLTLLDLAFFGWYGWNVASLGWTFSLSEGLFFTQKVLLTGLVFWFGRQMWLDDSTAARRSFFKMTVGLSLFSIALGVGQLLFSASKNGLSLRNDALYDFVSGVSGNKGLFTDFLFFLLIFNVFSKNEYKNERSFWLVVGGLLGLILILQTRTVYLAVGVCAAIYFIVRASGEPDFRPIFKKRVLPVGLVVAAGLAMLIFRKNGEMTLSERLNPLTWLESASANERRFVWYKTGLLCDEHPLAGVGNGSWKLFFPSKSIQGAWRLQEKGIIFTRVHNDWLEIRAELGWVGLALFALLFGLAAIAAVRVFRKMDDPMARHDLLTASLGLVGYGLISTFDFPRERPEMQVIFGLLFSIVAWRTADFFEKMPSFSIKSMKNGIFWAMTAGLMFNLVVGFYRVRGEIWNVETVKTEQRKNYSGLVKAAQAAENPFYEFNDVALPLKWFEGLGFYQQNKIDEATACFAEAYRLNPWSFQVINNYASILVKNQKYREAVPLFERALEINPRYDEGRFNLSFAEFQLGNYQKSLDLVYQTDSTNVEFRQKRADFLKEILPKINR